MIALRPVGRHLGVLLAAGAVVAVGCLLDVRADGSCRLLGFIPPPMCLSQLLLGVPCPGCGLTRSVACLLQGDLRASLAFHPLGWLAGLVIVFQIPYRLWLIFVPRPSMAWFALKNIRSTKT